VQFHKASVGGLQGAVNLSVSSRPLSEGMLNSDALFAGGSGRDSPWSPLVEALRRGNAEGNAALYGVFPLFADRHECPSCEGTNSRPQEGRSYPSMSVTLAGFHNGRRFLPPEPAVVVSDRPPQRSGGVSDPLPKAPSGLPPGPGGSLTPPLRRCLFTWHATVHAGRPTSAVARALRPRVASPTRERHTRHGIRIAGRAARRIDL
jgi:hypothetical protein